MNASLDEPGRECNERAVVPRGPPSREELHQQGNVSLPVAERRNPHGDDVQPEQQILAKCPLEHVPRKVAIRGGDDT